MNGSRLRQARELKGWLQRDLAEAARVAQPTVARLERGSLEPSDELLGRVAVCTGFPKRFFLEADPVELPDGSFLRFRSRRSKVRAADLAYVHQLAQAAVTIYEHLADRFNRFRVLLPQLDEDEAADTAADLIRSAIGVRVEAPMPRLVHTLERAGVVCVAIPAGELGDFDGFSARLNGRPAIILNCDRPPEAVRMTAAHEVAHLTWPEARRGSIRAIENAAAELAGRLLLPQEGIAPEMPAPVTLSGLAELKPRWGVEVKALIVRAHRLQLVGERQYKGLLIQHRRLWPNGEPEDKRIAAEKPRAMSKMAEEIYGSDWKSLAKEIGFPVWLVEKILDVQASRRDLLRVSAPGKVERPPGRLIPFELPSRSSA